MAMGARGLLPELPGVVAVPGCDTRDAEIYKDREDPLQGGVVRL